jgi:hypothetical protein
VRCARGRLGEAEAELHLDRIIDATLRGWRVDPVAEAQRWTGRLARLLDDRRPDIDRRLDYYRGTSGLLRFASKEFGQFNSKRYQGFADNWCAPVVQPTAERMVHQGIILPGERSIDPDAQRAWMGSDCDRGSSEAYVVFSAAAVAYALVHPGDEPRVTWEHPGQAIVDTDPVTGERRRGLVSWVDDRYDYATLYDKKTVWKWRRPNNDADTRKPAFPARVGFGWSAVPVEESGDDTWPIKNPFGLVPLVEMRNQSLLDDRPISDIDGVMAMQDAINLVWAYLLNALDYASLPQRIVTGADVPVLPVLDSDGKVVGSKPVDLNDLIQERILWLQSKDAKTSEWSAARLDVFSDVIERAVEHVAAQTRTPPHYLVAKMVNTSGDALVVAEAGLVSKVRERITYVTAPHRSLYELIFLGLNQPEKARGARYGQLKWSDPQYRSDAQRADALLKKRQMGYPFEYILELDGLEPDEVARVMAMRRAEASDPTMQALMDKLDGAAVGG